MTLEFSEREMVDYLLMHGYVITEQGKTIERNIYQNVFEEERIRIIRAIKGDIDLPLEEAFRNHIKKQLLNQI